ncbi:HNH endonuclease, partial [Vibrio cholerae]
MFEVGAIYNRRSEIHGVYKGQQYGGIATPANHPYVFIFTSDAGEE